MDDLNGFEAQLGRVLQGAAGPSQPTDVAAMVRVATTPSPSPLARLFGATRLAVAGMIVALFSGFLVLSLLLTADDREASVGASPSTSPAAIERLRESLETETIAPGIERVVDDGADHDLTFRSADPEGRGFDHVAVGPDGAVWLYRPSGELFRLGQDGAHATYPYFEGGVIWLDYLPDHSLATLDGRGQLGHVAADTSGGADWTEPMSTSQRDWYTWADRHVARLAPDAVWADQVTTDLAGELEAAVSERDFVPYPDDIWDVIGDDMGKTCAIAMTSDGTIWGGACGEWGMGFGGGALARYTDRSWRAVQPLDGTDNDAFQVSDIYFLSPGTDDTLWAAGYTKTVEGMRDANDVAPPPEEWQPGTLAGPVLIRLRDAEWSVFPLANVAGDENIHHESGAIGVTDKSGRLWLGAGDNIGVGRDGDFGGLPGKAALLSFDGETTSWHPDVGVVRDIELAEDGSLWVAGEDGVFIIDPNLAHGAPAADAPAPRYAITDSTLDGTTLEPIEPGVVRVDRVGGIVLQQLAMPGFPGGASRPPTYSAIASGSDGSVVFVDWDRLVTVDGSGREILSKPTGATDFEVAKDGTVWHASTRNRGPALFGTLGDEPWSQPSNDDMRGPSLIEVHPDGTVIGAWRDAMGDTVVARRWEDAWRPIGRTIPGAIDALHVSDGEVWIEQDGRMLNANWDDRSWRDLGELPDDSVRLDVGTNGIPRVLIVNGPTVSIGSYFDSQWTFDEVALEDGLVPLTSDISDPAGARAGSPFAEALDGGVWFALDGPLDADGNATCAGLARVRDGELTRYLRDECIGALEVVIDGSIWVQGLSQGSPIYVIRP